MTDIAMEMDHGNSGFTHIYPLNTIFHTYAKLPGCAVDGQITLKFEGWGLKMSMRVFSCFFIIRPPAVGLVIHKRKQPNSLLIGQPTKKPTSQLVRHLEKQPTSPLMGQHFSFQWQLTSRGQMVRLDMGCMGLVQLFQPFKNQHH